MLCKSDSLYGHWAPLGRLTAQQRPRKMGAFIAQKRSNGLLKSGETTTRRAVFDMEGVLVDGEYLVELAREVGKAEEIHALTEAGIRGEINWEEGLRRRVDLLQGISYERAQAATERLSFMPGARELCARLKGQGWMLISITGGFQFMSERAERELGLDRVYSNELLFEAGQLSGVRLQVTSDKAQVWRAAFGADIRPQVALVDGANDLSLLELAELKLAFNAQLLVWRYADQVIQEKNLALAWPLVEERFYSPAAAR